MFSEAYVPEIKPMYLQLNDVSLTLVQAIANAM